MLQEAHELLENGVDVKIGYIETHGRAGTEAMLQGLPVIPRRKIFYKGKELEEMDLDAIIRLHPEIVIVDELAHTNVEGSLNEKRWQDVMTLLDEGINVISAINIQHIESVNEEVQEITGIEVKERVPDSVIQEADEVVQQVFANDNPFTPNYRVTVDDPDNIEEVSAQLMQIDGVYSVKAPLAMADTFTSLQKVINYACYGLVAVLAIVSIVVINNTIKITVFNRRKEIGIMKLVGATNGFIRFPFFVEGVTSGLISAGIASGIVCGAYYALCRWYAENPSNLSQMFGGTLVPLESVWYYIVGGFVLLGFVLCGLGTATSIRKHLNV